MGNRLRLLDVQDGGRSGTVLRMQMGDFQAGEYEQCAKNYTPIGFHLYLCPRFTVLSLRR